MSTYGKHHYCNEIDVNFGELSLSGDNNISTLKLRLYWPHPLSAFFSPFRLNQAWQQHTRPKESGILMSPPWLHKFKKMEVICLYLGIRLPNKKFQNGLQHIQDAYIGKHSTSRGMLYGPGNDKVDCNYILNKSIYLWYAFPCPGPENHQHLKMVTRSQFAFT